MRTYTREREGRQHALARWIIVEMNFADSQYWLRERQIKSITAHARTLGPIARTNNEIVLAHIHTNRRTHTHIYTGPGLAIPLIKRNESRASAQTTNANERKEVFLPDRSDGNTSVFLFLSPSLGASWSDAAFRNAYIAIISSFDCVRAVCWECSVDVYVWLCARVAHTHGYTPRCDNGLTLTLLISIKLSIRRFFYPFDYVLLIRAIEFLILTLTDVFLECWDMRLIWVFRVSVSLWIISTIMNRYRCNTVESFFRVSISNRNMGQTVWCLDKLFITYIILWICRYKSTARTIWCSFYTFLICLLI